jgi:hypothetical protein
MALEPIDLAMSYVMRSGRIDLERLRRLSPRFVARHARERPMSSDAAVPGPERSSGTRDP